MLSILIPAYNQEVVSLVNELLRQCEQAHIPHLISVYDDCSRAEWKAKNAELAHTFNVNYVELSENIGRSKIRNWLADAAPHPLLLFLDGDSGIVRDDFVQQYIDTAKYSDVILGGTSYASKPPEVNKRLHWKYGKRVESASVRKRRQHPTLHFHSNNFLIRASVFQEVKFDESITQYGYEDILLGKKIENLGYYIHHIDNPVEHLGLETTEIFIEKQKKAIQNLVQLKSSDRLSETTLTSFYDKLDRWGMLQKVLHYFHKNEQRLIQKLYAPHPPLWVFQYAKLYWYHTALQEIK